MKLTKENKLKITDDDYRFYPELNGYVISERVKELCDKNQKDAEKFKIITTKGYSTERVREEIKENEKNKEDSEKLRFIEKNIGFKIKGTQEDIYRISKACETIYHLREYVDVMEHEPESWIKLSEVYHSLKRILGDEV